MFNESIPQFTTKTRNFADDFNGVNNKLLQNTIDNRDRIVTAEGKLSGIDEGANNYKHPTSHQASMIVQDVSRRFVSDSEKSTWNAKETTEGSLAKANVALQTAKNYVDGQVEDLERSVNEKTLNLEGTITEKVKLNGTSTNVNFIENKVVQDGLIAGASVSNFNSENDFSVFFEMEYKSSGEPVKIFGMGSSSTGGYQLVLGTSSMSLQYRKIGTTAWTTETVLQLSSGNLCTILMHKIKNSIYICVNGVWYRHTDLSIQNLTGTLSFSSSARYSISKQHLYNKPLTPQEINHNLSVLNNSPSINKINDYAISTDTDHITNRGNITQDLINSSFYAQQAREFSTVNGAISVNNGLRCGYVTGGTIEGQTVKNYALTFDNLSNFYTNGGSSIVQNKIVCTPSNGSGLYLNAFLKTSKTLVPNTTYKIVVFIYENTLSSSYDINSVYTDSAFDILMNIPMGTTGVKIFQATTKTDLTNVLYDIRSAVSRSVTGSISYNVCIISTTDNIQSYIPFGLSSTQAVLNVNGLKYSFYKDATDKASGTVLTLGGLDGARNTLKLMEDGSGVSMENTKEIVFDSTFNITLHSTSGEFTRFRIAPKIADNVKGSALLCNNFKYVITNPSTPTEESINNHAVDGYYDFWVQSSRASTVELFKTWLQSNPTTVRYQLATPVVTVIPKELMPAILTQPTNNITSDSAVLPYNMTLNIPTTDDIKKAYNITLLNGYVQVTNSFAPRLALTKNNRVEITMDLTSPSVFNSTICSLPTELRPSKDIKVNGYVDNIATPITIKATGEVQLPTSVVSKNVYVKDTYRLEVI